jgi:hypothetical protein
VIVTGAFFADAATTHDGKLNVLGGVWTHHCIRNISAAHSFTLVTLVQYEHDDAGRVLPLEIEVIDDEGETVAGLTVNCLITSDEMHGYLVSELAVTFAKYGLHKFLVSSNSGSPISVALDIRPDNN